MKPSQQVHDPVGLIGAMVPHPERTQATKGFLYLFPDGRPLSWTPLLVFRKRHVISSRSPGGGVSAVPDAWAWAKGEDEQFTSARLLAGLDEIHRTIAGLVWRMPFNYILGIG